MKARSVVSVVIFLLACFTSIATQSQPSVNLSGRWNANDGGTYYLRQLGNELWWYGQSGDGGASWSNVYQGAIRGNQISGRWVDVPHGRVQGAGVMDLVINNPNQITATNRSGGFGGSVWTRQGAVAVTQPPPPPIVTPPTQSGNWTAWINRDSPDGQADWEALADMRGQVPCARPIAVECRVASDKRDWRQAGQRYKCSMDEPNPGGICLNSENPGGCLDYEVRYLCPAR